MKSSFIIYYTEDGVCKSVEVAELNTAISEAEGLRKKRRDGADIRHVTMSAEYDDMVGQIGVTAVENGKTPDGQDYTWKKRRE